MPLIVRDATPADVPAIAALYADEVRDHVNTYEYDVPDEAEMARRMRELVAAGMPDAKLARVVGLAASDLLEPNTPRSAANRRITITVLTREAEERLMGKGIPTVTSTELSMEKQENPEEGR